ncbi:oxidoreductase [Capsulimonas corticalis]|uniref:Oxidoreductase n=1 Tax=Capsulimonas corticalis TaxID=2219043 RepID=A0A402D749_9BACT|nr:aldo/keto reductase [Capsulimonas corticalis]BDI29751.1 oxidoreductase [Capsulimonas corticalis]
MERRPFGQTGWNLSILGFGAIIVTDVTTDEAARYVGEAIDRGVNYFDIAPSYGNAEEMLGPALAPYRDDVFLACKTGKRDAAGAREELEESLRKLQTDHFDLYQLHAMTSAEDVQQVFAPGGAMETFVKAREEGKVRRLGFSAHSVEAALSLMGQFDFDSILFPFNFVTFEKAGFGPQVLEEAQRRGVARLALKGMARGPWRDGDPNRSEYPKPWYEPLADRTEAAKALRYCLSLPITAAIPPGDIRLFRMALDIADAFTPLTDDERADVQKMAQSETPLFTVAA